MDTLTKTQQVLLNKNLKEIRQSDFDLYTFLLSKSVVTNALYEMDLLSIGEKFNFDMKEVLWNYYNLGRLEFEDQIEFEKLSIERIADYLLVCHHAYVKSTLPELLQAGDEILQMYAGKYPGLKKIIELFSSLAEDLQAHITEEEESVFAQLISNKNQDTVGSLNQFEIEHEEAEGILKQLNLLCDGFNCPYRSKEIEQYYSKLEEFSNKLYAHIHIEKKYLFKRITKKASK